MRRSRDRAHPALYGPSLAILLALLVGAAAVYAHAHYAHSNAGIGEVVATSPAAVDIYTDQELRKQAGANTITVKGTDGVRVDDGNTVVDDRDRRHFSTGVRPGLAMGRYVVNFTTLSDEDGDPDRGHFAFYVARGPTAAERDADAQLGANGASANAPSKAGAGRTTVVMLAAAATLAGVAVLIGLHYIWRHRPRTPAA